MPEAPREVRFSLSISAQEWLPYYRGAVRDVVVKATDGRVVRFPARVLQRFLTTEGVRGHFILKYDERGRFQAISRANEI